MHLPVTFLILLESFFFAMKGAQALFRGIRIYGVKYIEV